MYQKILVPLDGSKLAETILPHAEMIAKEGGGEVILATVTERIAATVGPVIVIEPVGPMALPNPLTKIPVALGKQQKQGQRYLTRIAKRLTKKGIRVHSEVLLGNPAGEIADYAVKAGVDLIVMASHGRSGVGRWAFGSVSDKVLRISRVPVLLVRSAEHEPAAG